MASKCSRERKICTSLSLDQKLKIIKLNEDGISKAEICQKLDQRVNQVENANANEYTNYK